ncbi:MAG: hypothetical protein IAG10_12940 [Planctomycetaceae bacterium]|nr:hypothetical protein [Planctomycetaceae bacterium]
MPTHSSLCSSEENLRYPAPKKYVLVLSCVDARLLDDLVRFLDQDNLANRYYHVTLPGTALGLTDRVKQDSSDKDLLKQFRRWRQTFIDQVRAAVLLTKGQITDIYIVQHEDCGAFRVYIEKDSAEMSPEDELNLHQDYAHALLKDIAKNFFSEYHPIIDPQVGKPEQQQKKKPLVHTFYMDLRGHVKHLESSSH